MLNVCFTIIKYTHIHYHLELSFVSFGCHFAKTSATESMSSFYTYLDNCPYWERRESHYRSDSSDEEGYDDYRDDSSYFVSSHAEFIQEKIELTFYMLFVFAERFESDAQPSKIQIVQVTSSQSSSITSRQLIDLKNKYTKESFVQDILVVLRHIRESYQEEGIEALYKQQQQQKSSSKSNGSLFNFALLFLNLIDDSCGVDENAEDMETLFKNMDEKIIKSLEPKPNEAPAFKHIRNDFFQDMFDYCFVSSDMSKKSLQWYDEEHIDRAEAILECVK